MDDSSVDICFRIFDPLSRGSIAEEEACALLRAVTGISDLTDEEAHATVKAMDVECTGRITRTEFQRVVQRKLLDKSAAEDAWRSFTFLTEGRGRLCAEDFAALLEVQCLSPAEFRSIARKLEMQQRPVHYELWKKSLGVVRQQ